MVKFFLIIILLSTYILSIENNPYFKSDADVEKWFWDSSATCDRTQYSVGLVDIVHQIWKIETYKFIKGICGPEGYSIYIIYNLEKDSLQCGYGYIAGIDFKEDSCSVPKMTHEQRDKIKVAAYYFIRKALIERITAAQSEALVLFKNKKKEMAANVALGIFKANFFNIILIPVEIIDKYNDLGYFLEEGGKYKEAAIMLEQVVKTVPDRSVAYLNLADAYWGLKDTSKACSNYKKYVDIVLKDIKNKKIPSRISERCPDAK